MKKTLSNKYDIGLALLDVGLGFNSSIKGHMSMAGAEPKDG